ncbi:MAG: hypothetical protein IDH49_10165 [Gammaproteobacteria bacterium]|nr:hypothetical protein [Gammaproteobacteria bacterium]
MKRAALIFIGLMHALGHPALAANDGAAPSVKIIGDDDMPKALYIVPWRKPALTPPPERAPKKEFIDDAFATLDQDILAKQIQYHELFQGK